MSKKKNFIQIAESISAITGCSKSTAEVFLKSMFSLLADLIQDGKKVKIKGVGTFCKSENADEPIMFEPDKGLAEIVNLPFSSFECVELDDDVTDEVFNKELKEKAETIPQEEPNVEAKEEATTLSEEIIATSPEKVHENVDESETMEQKIVVDEPVDVPQSELAVEIAESKENSPVEMPEISVATPVDESNNSDEEIFDNEIDENKSHGVGKTIFMVSVVVALLIGFGAGYMTKLIMENIELKKQLVSQQSQIDSIMTANAVDTLKTTETVKTDTSLLSASVVPVDSSKVVEPQKAKQQYDTVKANRFLTTMARQYYGNLNFWVYIYEENQAIMGHPNKIKPGTVVKIPPAEKYGIDANNPASVQKAKVKAVEIYSRYQK